MKHCCKDDIIPSGTECFFEYHCKESYDSSDAELWYRSHNPVIVLKCVNAEYFEADKTMKCRIESNGAPLAYEVRFADGFLGIAIEDELLWREADYERPNPPGRSQPTEVAAE